MEQALSIGKEIYLHEKGIRSGSVAMWLKKKLACLMAVLLCVTMLSTGCSKGKEDGESSSGASASQSSSSDGSSGKDTSEKESSDKDGASAPEDGEEDAPEADQAETGLDSALPPPNFEDKLYCKNIYMLNLDSGERVYGKDEQARIYPASLTKIMTCIVALENVKDLDNETTHMETYIQNYLYTNGIDTLGGIYADEYLSIRDLLYAMMLPSANDAAMIIADYVGGGDIEKFCEMMNEKAREIGAKNTNFTNPSGLFDENNYSTAYDLALIAQYAWENEKIGETFQEIVTTNAYKSKSTTRHPDGITWYSRNRMQQSSQQYYYQGLRGMKTGSLPEQNITHFISTATRDGYTYLLVALNAPIYREADGAQFQDNLAFLDTRDLYNWAFETFTVKTLMTVGQEVAEIDVRLSWDTDHIKLVAADKFAKLVANEVTADSINRETVFPNLSSRPSKEEKGKVEYYIDAPVKKGTEVGYVRLLLAGQEIGQVRLVAAETVERSNWLYYVDQAKTFLKSFVFKFVLIFLIVLVVLYVLLMIIRNHNRRRYRMKRRPPRSRQRPK